MNSFLASTITGSSRGKSLGFATINLVLSDIPENTEEGVYAATVVLEDDTVVYKAAVHYGPRPVFADGIAFEVHLIDESLNYLPPSLTVTLIQKLRDVQDFDSTEQLQEQIRKDIANCRTILS